MTSTPTGMLDRNGVIAYVGTHASQYGLDAAAVLSVANHEGLNTKPGATWQIPGESGINFGPPSWYTGGAGGPIQKAQGVNAAAWSWTPAGLDLWLSEVAGSGAANKQGDAAISAIVTGFERPAAKNVQPEITNAHNDYQAMQAAVTSAVQGNPIVTPQQGSTPATGANTGGTTDTTPTTTTTTADQLTGTAGAIQTGLLGAFDSLSKGIFGSFSGLIIFAAAVFAIIIGAIIWNGESVKKTVVQAPSQVATAAMFL